ncbi:hypothetical protein RRG08_042661 [Elysia crispata]|uniref:Uncharacterized protein n=1 Tax=Elysia crispata TaxID=231223 RepID=A0AAE0XQG2_9GAST|nr:hypothetical protein RRG08_042661 [Elysia crispata]
MSRSAKILCSRTEVIEQSLQILGASEADSGSLYKRGPASGTEKPERFKAEQVVASKRLNCQPSTSTSHGDCVKTNAAFRMFIRDARKLELVESRTRPESKTCLSDMEAL